MLQLSPLPRENGEGIDYHQLLQYLPVAIYTCDSEGFITDFNDSAVALWGRTPEAGKDRWTGAWKIYDEHSRPMAPDDTPMAQAIKSGGAVSGQEIIIERPDGSKRNVIPHPRALYDAAGKVSGAVNMLEDITERKVNEQRQASLAAIVECSDDAIISKNLNGIVTSWNASAERIFGYSAEEMIGTSITRLIPPDRINEEVEILSRLKRGERIDHFQTRRMAKDRRMLDVSLSISPLHDSAGKITGISKTARDITKEKELEGLAREEEERFRMAVEATNLGTWTYNPMNGDLYWSDECRNIYDLPQNMQVSYELFSKLLHPDDAEMVQWNIGRALEPAGSGKYDIQFRILRYSDNHIRWIRSQGKVHFNANGEPEKFIGTVLDITDDKVKSQHLETLVAERTKDLAKVNEALAQSNKELEQFAYVASHDLQEPLRKITTFADMLRERGAGILNDELDGYIGKIIASSGKMGNLIKDLLEYAKMNSAANTLTRTDLNAVLRSVTDDLESQIARENALIHADNLPVIDAIPTDMHQLFFNLINNSIKFKAPERTPVVILYCRPLSRTEIEAARLDAQKEYYKIDFTDNGIGFDAKNSGNIFSMFHRLDNSDQVQGTGIGLALCKKIVDKHHGRLTAKGKENKGATFSVILPATSGNG
ncbi:MAG: PAS domain S-box protein [Bacteroidota bacterium]